MLLCLFQQICKNENIFCWAKLFICFKWRIFYEVTIVIIEKKFEPTNKKIPKKLCTYASLVYRILTRVFDFYGKIARTEIISCVVTVIIPCRCVVTESDLFSFQAKHCNASSVSHYYRPIECGQPEIFNRMNEYYRKTEGLPLMMQFFTFLKS